MSDVMVKQLDAGLAKLKGRVERLEVIETVTPGGGGHSPVTLGNYASRLLTLTGQALTTPTAVANTVYRGPTSGAAAQPNWGTLVALDLPGTISADHIGERTGGHGVVIDNTLTLPASTIVPNGGTIGQAAGPLLTFDDTLNALGITGCNVGIGTTNPSKPLTVSGGSSGTTNILFELWSPFGTGGTESTMRFVNSTDGTASTRGGEIGVVRMASDDTEEFIFRLGTATNEVLRIKQNGKAGIKITAPTAWLHLPAATAAANTASLKIDPGIKATTPVSGNIESDGTHLYWTDSGGTRRQLDN